MTVTKAKEILLKRIKAEENMFTPPYGVSGVYALRKAAVVLDDVEKGKLVERKKGKWDTVPMNDGIAHYTLLKCSECGGLSAHPTNFCRDCGADMRGETWTN